jgi:hypothetical protein
MVNRALREFQAQARSERDRSGPSKRTVPAAAAPVREHDKESTTAEQKWG